MKSQKWHQIILVAAAIALSMSLNACGAKDSKEPIRSGAHRSKLTNPQGLDAEQSTIEEANSKVTESGGLENASAAQNIENQINNVKMLEKTGAAEEASQEGLTELNINSSETVGEGEVLVAGEVLESNGSITINGQPVNTAADVYIETEEDGPEGPMKVTTKVSDTITVPQRQHINPIITGATDLKQRFFTDGKDDVVMARLVNRMNELRQTKGDEFFNDSIELATRLYNVDVSANIRDRSVYAMVQFKDGNKNVEVLFQGALDQYNRTPLQQVVQAKDYGYKFNAYVTCIDANRVECKNTILVIEHVVNNEICKRIMIVHRFGDARFTISDYDYVNFSGFLNPYARDFVQYIANTAHFNRYLYSCVYSNNMALNPAHGDQTCDELQRQGAGLGFNGRLPRARVLGYRSWAAAYGAAYFNIFFRESERAGQPIDVLHLYGPLLHSSAGPAYDRDIQVDGYLTTPEGHTLRGSGQSFGEKIKGAQLLSNDGRGNLKMAVDLKGSPATKIHIDFDETLGETMDPINLHLYPTQPRGSSSTTSTSNSAADDNYDEDVPPDEMGS